MKPHLTTSARPATRSAARQRGQRGQVAEHAGRRVERADQVLAGRGVDAGLAADRGVDHAEQRRRYLHHAYAAQPARGDEPGQVGHRAAADTDHRVGTGEPGRPERVPAPGRDLDRLARLGVGHLDRQRRDTGVRAGIAKQRSPRWRDRRRNAAPPPGPRLAISAGHAAQQVPRRPSTSYGGSAADRDRPSARSPAGRSRRSPAAERRHARPPRPRSGSIPSVRHGVRRRPLRTAVGAGRAGTAGWPAG